LGKKNKFESNDYNDIRPTCGLAGIDSVRAASQTAGGCATYCQRRGRRAGNEMRVIWLDFQITCVKFDAGFLQAAVINYSSF